MEKYKSSHDWYLKSNGYIYCAGDGTTGFNATFNNISKCPNEDAMLTITLDIDEQQIWIAINEQEAESPDSFRAIRRDKYRLVVTMYGASDTIIELL